MSFSELLVTTHGALNLERPRRPNSLQLAMISATTEACIIASAGLGTLSRSPVGPLAVSRSADMVTSQVKAFAPQSSGLGPFAL